MNISQTILTLLAAQLIISISPGPSTVLIMHSASRGRKLGFAAAAGNYPAGFFWASLGLGGLGSLLAMQPKLVTGMYLICGSYLIWLGIKSIRNSFAGQRPAVSKAGKHLTPSAAARAAFMANIANPKTIAYYASIFAATNMFAAPLPYQITAAILMPTVTFIWFCGLVMLVSHKAVKKFLENSRHWLDRIAGLMMMGFGVRLLMMLGD
jgi:threonine efflux protein